jgi:glycogen synthase
MKILLCSVPYPPSIGGIETVSEILADRFKQAGHDVHVATLTATDERHSGPINIMRRPSLRAYFEAVRWADVVVHNNISLKFAWPLLILRRPWVIAHHMWSPRSGPGGLLGRLKHFATHFGDNIAVSSAMARTLSVPATIIPNPYDDDLFVLRHDAIRSRDIVFVGRLVESKGAALLLEAMARLRQLGKPLTLTIVGGGPEEAALRHLTRVLDLEQQVSFRGFMKGNGLVDILHEHRIMVVPSTAAEPFGIVALEGIACGLVPIVARSGGLPDAIGNCGVVVPPSDSVALATAISALDDDPTRLEQLTHERHGHLPKHTRQRVADSYLRVIELALAKSKRRQLRRYGD